MKNLVSVVQQKSSEISPTDEAYGTLQFAYDYFNVKLFGGRLPRCLITLVRNPRALGYFAPERFKNIEGMLAHEIGLNPQYIEAQGDYIALSTLEHEQCHVSRYMFGPKNMRGKSGTVGYHDRAWADEMLRVGLIPSDTGMPGGKQTGPSMSDYPSPDGPFDLACRELLVGGFVIDWRDSNVDSSVINAGGDDRISRDEASRGRTGHRPTRAKFTCPSCRLNAWAKPSAQFACLSCSASMIMSSV